MNFDSVKWHDEITSALKNNIKNNTLGHAVLFTGETDTSIKLANAVADSVLCKEKTGNACLICSNCVKTISGSHPDKYIIKAQKASISVEEIREFINLMYVRPCNSDKKVFIFEEADKLTEQAQNALLKILEQPPEYGIIILVAKKEENLLRTVLSRLTKYTVSSPTVVQTSEYLMQKFPEKRDMAAFASKFCNGNLNEAENFLKIDCDFEIRKRIIGYFNDLKKGNLSSLFNFSAYLIQDKEKYTLYATYILNLFHDIIILKTTSNREKIINTDLEKAISDLSENISVSSASKVSELVSDSLSAIKSNASLKLNTTNMLIKIREELHDRSN